ncbi:MAG: 2'-5' RNA ligase family protein [Actinobacteria bacterium]|nr:2'-5' RNA ligase family protein [Actinomycetota bacterium]
MTAEPQAASTVQNHWWWRPGWRVGRHYYACHLTLDDLPKLRELVQQYQDVMSRLPNLDLIPPQWLHVTMQGIGFVDEVSDDELAAVTEHLRELLRRTARPVVTFHRPTIRREAVVLKAEPAEPLRHLRMAMYDTIAPVLDQGTFSVSEPRPGPGQFTPHVSAAYVNDDGPAEPIAEAIGTIDPEPVTVTFRAASLLVFHRDHRMYEWTQATPLPIGPAGSAS